MTLIEGAIEDETGRVAALSALSEVSLIKHDPFEDGTPAVIVHRLVLAVARARANAKAIAQHAVERFIARLVAIYPEDDYDNPARWPRCAQLTPHLLATCEETTADVAASVKCANLLNRAGSYFDGRAAYSEARPLLKRAVAIREELLGAEHPDTAASLNNLAQLLRHVSDFTGARPLLKRALAIREELLGPKHPHTATTLHNLASLLRDESDLAGARPLCERALAIREEVLVAAECALVTHQATGGPHHPWTKDAARITADALAALGRADEAVQRYGRLNAHFMPI